MGDSFERYRLHPAAERDLEEIWRFTAERWTASQAEQYVDELVRTFDLILRHPAIAAERTAIHPPVRLHRHRSHFVVYRCEAPLVLILRVLHARQNWRALLGADSEHS
jgi:toxin ParE1/3/4